VDKLSPLSKLDIYLFSRGKPPLDRGSKTVQPMAEIINSRNQYVHRKVRKRKSEFINDPNLPHYMIEAEQFSNHLGLCRNPTIWSAENAMNVLHSLTEFFDFYFLQCCQHNPKEVKALLLGGFRGFELRSRAEGRSWTPREIRALLKKKIISLKFLGG
jgi:hypothetical protein